METKTLFFEFDKYNPDIAGYLFAAVALQKPSKWPNEKFESMHSDGQFIVGTNGHRLHRYKPKECLPKGWYKPIKKTKTSLWLISVDTDIEPVKYSHIATEKPELVDFGIGGCDARLPVILRLMEQGQCLNIGYFNEATPAELIDKYEKPEPLKPVFFYGDNAMAMLMPMST